MASGVMDWSHSRSLGSESRPVYSTMRRKMSSPSRPASQASMVPVTSLRRPSFWICLSRVFWPSRGLISKSPGTMGRFLMAQERHFLS